MDGLLEGARGLGVSLSEKQLRDFEKYRDMLLDWNQRMNLTAITDEKEIVGKHFLDSLSLCAAADLSAVSLADVGAGAGFPSIPLKIAFPRLEITLLDALSKRVDFLNAVIGELAFDGARALHMRAEDAGQKPSLREAFDIVTARAVADLSLLAEYCLPLARQGGFFLAMKGPKPEAEVEAAKKAVDALGGRADKMIKTNLPGDINHSIIVIEKIRATPLKYPRKAGKAAKEPIK